MSFLLCRQVYGHVGECGGRRTPLQPRLQSGGADGGDEIMSIGSSSSRGGSLSPREANTHLRSSKAVDGQRAEPVKRVCVVSGDISTTRNWYGFLRNLSLEAGGGYRFLFTYPSAMQVTDPSSSSSCNSMPLQGRRCFHDFTPLCTVKSSVPGRPQPQILLFEVDTY